MKKKHNNYNRHKEKCDRCRRLIRYNRLAKYHGETLCWACIPNKLLGPNIKNEDSRN